MGGFSAYGFLVRRVPTSVATTFSYVNPVVAVGLGWPLLGEPVTARMLAATAVLIAGVFLIVSAERPEPARRARTRVSKAPGANQGEANR